MDVGLVGTGRLGSAIGTRLLECGHRLFVWNRTDEKARPLVDRGAIRCATPADLAATAGTVLSVVTDASAIESVYFGSNGLLTNGGEGKTFVDEKTTGEAFDTDGVKLPAIWLEHLRTRKGG